MGWPKGKSRKKKKEIKKLIEEVDSIDNIDVAELSERIEMAKNIIHHSHDCIVKILHGRIYFVSLGSRDIVDFKLG